MPSTIRLWTRRALDAVRLRLFPLGTTTPSRRLAQLATDHSRLATTAHSPSSLISPFKSPMSTSEIYGNFDLIRRVKLNFTDVSVSKWRSRVTGLTVVHLDYDAPIVKGYFAVGTEIFDDSGCPHTLEHLVFMGSEKYPYKGIIDHFANRGFSNGTNAWTATDHTVYTVATAGAQGFLQLLPIYVDHILYPTITKAAYLTEVHHVDPKGEDAGVVYSEMQGRQNTSGDLMELSLQRLVNPEDSAYRSETGGLMEALRVLSVDKIREYHHEYYVPHNLSLIVAGKIAGETEALLNVVQEQIEPSIIAHGQDKGPRPPGWKRPFLETPSANRAPLTNDIEATVEFPEKDESSGELVIYFMGPSPDDYLERKALDILSTYLTSSPIAPLNKEFVEVENPLCTYIYPDENVRPKFVDLPIYVGSVPTEHLDDFPLKIRDSLKKIAEEGIDMDRMAMVINRDQRQLRSKLETSKGDTFSTTVITDFLLGPEDGSGLLAAMDEMNYYDSLRRWTAEEWASLLRRYFVGQPAVVVRGVPSVELAEKIEKDEKKRVEEQVKRLGPEGLERVKQELEEAKAEHDVPIPIELLKSFPVPDVKSIKWIAVESVQEGASTTLRTNGNAIHSTPLRDHINSDGTELPFFVEYDHVQSDFVTIHALLSLADIPNDLRPAVTAYLSSFFSLPVTRSSGEKLSHEEVVDKLDDETVSYEAELGLQGYFAEIFRVSIKVETTAYEEAVRWLADLIYGSEFDPARLQVACAKILRGLPELKRDGNNVMASVQSEILYDASSTTRANAVLAQAHAIPALLERLKTKPEEAVKDFETIRTYLTNPSGIRFSVTGDVLSLKKPRSVWAEHFGGRLPKKELLPVKTADLTLSAIGKAPKEKAIVVSLPTIESAYAIHSAKAIKGFEHPDLPALKLAVEVLDATESFLWRYIRGSGLAYGAAVTCDVESGLLHFSLYRSSNSTVALEEATRVVKGLVDGSIELDDIAIDAAKSSVVYNLTRGVSTPHSAAITSFVNQALKGCHQNYHLELLEKYQAVTKDDVLHALKTYVLPLFDPKTSVAVVVTAPGKVEHTVEKLDQLGFKVESRTVDVEPEEMDGTDSESESEGESDGSSER